MRTNIHAAVLAAMVIAAPSIGFGQQFTNPGAGGWWHTVNAGTNPQPTRGVSIGNVGAGPYPSVFNIRGELLPAINQTPEVFRTTAPTTGNTYWRMFQGGTGAGFERGQLFAVPGQDHFNINAPNGHLRLYTNTLERARLNSDATYTIGAFANQNADGYMGISPNESLWTNGPGPFSRLHLHDGTNAVLQASYRPWMDNGLTFTTNSDQMYVGHKVEPGTDQTAAVVQWGDNSGGSFGPDVMKFLFTSTLGDPGSQGTANGREIARLHPSGWLGVGDWQAQGLQPTERVDLLNGRLRIRDLPDDPPANYLNKVLVVEDFPLLGFERGVVKWRDISTIIPPPTADCDWEITGNIDVVTAYDPAPAAGCPGLENQVGIGTDQPRAKLHVVKEFINDPMSERGIFCEVTTETLDNTGVYGSVTGPNEGTNRGVWGEARNAIRNFGVVGNGIAQAEDQYAEGVRGFAAGSFQASDVVGTSGSAWNARITSVGGNFMAFTQAQGSSVDLIGVSGRSLSLNDADRAIGVYGLATGAANANNWAIWSQGEQYSATSSTWFFPSDENLKTNVEEFTGALDILASITPKRYDYNTVQYGFMGLAQGPQIGLLAQEVENVLPELVRNVHRPADRDSLGNEINPAMDFKAMQYGGLIPVLVDAVKEQQATITTMQQQLHAMQQQLAACCAAPPSDTDQRLAPTGAVIDLGLDPRAERMLTIQPNPFTDQTTLRYTLERAGRAQLLVNSGDGRHLRVLSEAQLEAGEYQHVWNTAHLAPGVYYVTLLLDGEPLAKRAVKL